MPPKKLTDATSTSTIDEPELGSVELTNIKSLSKDAEAPHSHAKLEEKQGQGSGNDSAIRAAVPGDADEIAALAVEAWRPIRHRQLQTLGAEQFALKYGPDWEAVKAEKVRECCQSHYIGRALVAVVARREEENESVVHGGGCCQEVIMGFVSFGAHHWQRQATGTDDDDKTPDELDVSEPPLRNITSQQPAHTTTVIPSRAGEIWNNAVHPDYQGRGVATRLYLAALTVMRTELDFQHAVVGVGPENTPACRAYARAAFRRIDPRDPFLHCGL